MGLKAGDLEDLVSHIISVDEFESKIDNDKAIVVGFKVDDKEPAQDLSRFIEKSAVDLMDTEVSGAPDTDGKYVVFVEYARDREFPSNLCTTLESMENLTGIKKENYRFTAYKKKGEHEVEEDILRRKVRLKPMPKKDDAIVDFLGDSGLDDATIADGKLTIVKNGKELCYEVVDLMSADKLFSHYKLDGLPFTMNETARVHSRDMYKMLGAGYTTNLIKGFLLVSKANTEKALLLQDNS